MYTRPALKKRRPQQGPGVRALGCIANHSTAITAYLAFMTSTRREGANRARLWSHSLKLGKTHDSAHIISTSTMACTTLNMTADCNRRDGHCEKCGSMHPISTRTTARTTLNTKIACRGGENSEIQSRT